jgi:hypothetical protein
MTFTIGEKLYAVSTKGKIKVWWSEVTGSKNLATITANRCIGLTGKVITLKEVIDKGKHIGKTNETNAFQQAKLEVESKYRAKIRAGYLVTIPTNPTITLVTNSLGYLKPMLAPNKIPDSSKWPLPAFWQPKLDGHRAMVIMTNKGPVIYSRGGKIIDTMAHIVNVLSLCMNVGEYLDGELYLHGQPVNQIGRLIKKYRAGESEKIKFVIYDAPHATAKWTERLSSYKKTLSLVTNISGTETFDIWTSNLIYGADFVVPIFTCSHDSIVDIKDQNIEAIEQGFEGGMLRAPDMLYNAGGRERKLMKLKEFDDSEWKIIRIEEGKRYICGTTDIPQAIMKLELSPGDEFEVAAPGTKEEKAQIWHDRKKYIGQLCTIKHFGYTEYGKPWHPVAKCIREDI